MSVPEFFVDLKHCCVNIPQRWILAVMCFLGLFNAFAMRGCLSIAITEMVVPTAKQDFIPKDETCGASKFPLGTNASVLAREKEGLYEWSEYTQGLILGSFYWGYFLTHLPGGIIAEKYGGKHTLGFGVLLTAVFTIVTPLAVYLGDSTALIIVRALMGFGEGTTYPAVNVLLAQWTPPEERSRLASFVYAGALIGTIFTTTVSGWILQYSTMGWPLVFYVMGAISIVWFVIWLVTCYNSPREHPYISDKEANYLKERLDEHTHEKPPPVPWRHILVSKPLWAAIIALIGFNWAIITMITDLPKYMSGVLKFSVEYNGYLTSLVYLCTWSGAIVSSIVADYLTTKRAVSTTKVRKWGSVTALTVASSFIVGASYAGCDRTLVVGMFGVGMTLMGTAYPSVMINALDLSPNYAGTLMGLTNGLSALTGIFSPYVIGLVTPNQTLGEWRLVFWLLFGIAVTSNLIFLVFGSGDVEYWNDPDFVRKEMREMEGRGGEDASAAKQQSEP